MRQHVNPLSQFFQLYIEIPKPNQLFDDKNLPIHLDIGCAKGGFLFDLAKSNGGWNFLGIDIRNALIDFAEKERKNLEINNLRFIFCNANVSLENWLLALDSNKLERVSIQFPDPWFKRRHQKRRVLQPSLLFALASAMPQGSELFIQSDVYSVIKPMIELIKNSNCFDSSDEFDNLWLADNPFNVYTEREIYALKKGLTIYRRLFYRNKRIPEKFSIYFN